MGDFGSLAESKKFVVGINYPSYGCGRQSHHISFVDNVNSNLVGQVKEYGIRAIQIINGSEEAVTSMSVMPYRIPFLVKISGSVSSVSGVGVEGVTVSFCHIDPLTAKEDIDANFCPFQSFSTDKRGFFNGEFRISSPVFSNLIESFNVTANKTELLSDGTILKHVFSPPSQVVSLTHLQSSTVFITDNTSINVFGKIIFDPANTGGFICPFPALNINFVDGSGKLTTTSSASDGSFSFNVGMGESIVIYIPPFNGHEWDSFLTSKVDTPSLREPSMEPTVVPSKTPTFHPSFKPHYSPSFHPTHIPSIAPTNAPSSVPTLIPTLLPTFLRSLTPSIFPSNISSVPPSVLPSNTSQKSRKLHSYDTSASASCLFDDCTHKPCVRGTKCVFQSMYYSQCLLDSSTDLSFNCVSNYGKCIQSTDKCCSFAFTCSNDQCVPYKSPQCFADIPSSQPSVQPSHLPSAQPKKKPSKQPTKQPLHHPTSQPTAQPIHTPTHQPTRQPHKWPSNQPSRQPSAQPSTQPSRQPNAIPTNQPTPQPNSLPSLTPTSQPSIQPIIQPSSQPSLQPSAQPSWQPSIWPSFQPTFQPKSFPSRQPAKKPTRQPSVQPSHRPTYRPTDQPSDQPVKYPTTQPLIHPTVQPTNQPRIFPSKTPSDQPTSRPSRQPTCIPSNQPTISPICQPTRQPTARPFREPTMQPSGTPTKGPTSLPSLRPSCQPSSQSTNQPVAEPSVRPSRAPTKQPSNLPSMQPTAQPLIQHPSREPSREPSNLPSLAPTLQPTTLPSYQPLSQPSHRPTAQPRQNPSIIPSFFPLAGPSRQPSALPSHQPIEIPSIHPTLQPFLQPSFDPSLQPISNPSLIPTIQPFKFPSLFPSLQPSIKPTSRPTTYIESLFELNETDPVLLHKFSFNDDATSKSSRRRLTSFFTGTFDKIGNTTAYLSPGVTLINGHADFDYYNYQRLSYISLPSISLGAGKIVTIEVWADFKSTNDVKSTLFSFGDRGTERNFTAFADFNQQGVLYLTYIYNPLKGYSKTYINGGFSSQTIIPKVPLFESNVTDHFAYIGRNIDGTGPGMTASIDEFRIYSGELSPMTINSHFIVGVDPSHVYINSKLTLSNVNVTFVAISKQTARVKFSGGASSIPIFGPEIKFDFASVDNQCGYKVTIPLDTETSSLTTTLAAMNYTVSLSPSSETVQAPLFTSEDCDYQHPLTTCKCAKSKTPFEYLSDSNSLQQEIVVTEVNQSIPEITFSYHSGVCFEVVGSENFPTSLTVQEKQACFPFSRQFCPVEENCESWPYVAPTIFSEGVPYQLTIVLFERYPEGYKSTSYLVDKYVANAVVSISDPASGFYSPQSFNYNTTLVRDALSQSNKTGYPVALNYSIIPKNPYPISPFCFRLQIFADRQGPDGQSYISAEWYIPVTGIIANEVPNFIPVASDPTLIYFVLRDPPGGSSWASLSSETSIQFEMSVGDMFTYDGSFSSESSLSGGVDGQFGTVDGLGFAVQNPLLGIHATASGGSNHVQSISTSRTSDSSYEYSISFGYDIITSSDPFTAGHASDIIVGGGVDLIVSEAIQGTRNFFFCFISFK